VTARTNPVSGAADGGGERAFPGISPPARLSLARSFLLPLALCAALAAPAAAVEIAYFAAPAPGAGRWTYFYALDEFPYDAGYGFTVYFDPELYADLDPNPLAPGEDWDAISVEPDAQLGEEGFYDAEALVDLPSVAASFSVSFRWLGAGDPGAQPFEVREPAPSFGVVESGISVAPEPGACGFGAAALVALAATRRGVA
jgi:hypothetical protein